jgi:ribosomal protein S18 acetylase RimI-like enzyme
MTVGQRSPGARMAIVRAGRADEAADGWRAGIYRLVVAREFRRAGLGSRLVDAAEVRVRELGAPKISALVLRDHDHAVGFWRAIGYELDERVERWTRLPS